MSRDDSMNQARWEALESILGSKLPALPSKQQMEMWKDTSWVGDYVEKVLEKSIPKKWGGHEPNPSSNHTAEVFETHNYVIVKLKMNDQANPNVKIRTDQIKIEGLVKNKAQIIKLPCHVIPSGSRASYKDGILQIKMKKKKINKSYHEVNVRYL
ncbi:Hsp20/alpha crystallin family protein [Paenibacillus sp. NPDC056579]|uniref:Hsp20/alpha crystallin family protein n=1 Tax=Paenibacillus sp. NPDC056579 TaxID=3345871 RepID=UPI00369C4F34